MMSISAGRRQLTADVESGMVTMASDEDAAVPGVVGEAPGLAQAVDELLGAEAGSDLGVGDRGARALVAADYDAER